MYGSKSKIPVARESARKKRPPLASAITLNKTPFCVYAREVQVGREPIRSPPKFSYPGLQANSLRETGSSWQFTLAVVSLTTRFNSSIEDHDTMRHEKKKREHRIGQCGRVLNGAWRRPLVLVALLGVFTSVAFGQLQHRRYPRYRNGCDWCRSSQRDRRSQGPRHQRGADDQDQTTPATTTSPSYRSDITPSRSKPPASRSAVTKDLPVEAGDRARNDVHMTIGSAVVRSRGHCRAHLCSRPIARP